MVRLSGFADEISADFDEQLATLEKEKIRFFELRGVWGKNVLMLSDEEVADIVQKMQAKGIGVSAIGSPIGKYDIKADFPTQMKQLERIIDIAKAVGTRYIRVFSFYIPESENPANYRDEVMARMRAMVEMADQHGLRLLHENERGIYGDTADRCVDLLDTLGPKLGCIFDPANFIQNGEEIASHCWPRLRKRVEYVHVKDALKENGRVVPAGEGDGSLKLILSQLILEDGFDGFLSLEPHLAVAGSAGGFSGPELFKRAADALKGILDELGVSYA